MKHLITLFLLLSTGSISTWAADASTGETLTKACTQCHGVAGNKPIANYPKLAGQHEKYLFKTLKEYQNGKRNNPIMSAQLKDLTIDDLADLAAYFSSQKGDLQ